MLERNDGSPDLRSPDGAGVERTYDRFFRLAVRCLLFAAVLMSIAFHVVRSFDPSRDELEGSMHLVAERYRTGLPSDAWLESPEMTLSPYGPTFFALSAVAMELLPSTPALAPGRLVSVFAGVVAAAVIAFVVARRVGAIEPGLAAALIYLGFPQVAFWLHNYRVDSLAATLAIAAYAAVGLPRRGLLWSAALVVAGSTVKQTVALAAVPIAIHLLLDRRWRDARRFAFLTAILGAAVWGTLFLVSDGYYLNLGVSGNRRDYLLRQLSEIVAEFVTNPITVLTAATLAVLWVRERWQILRCRFATILVVGGAQSAVMCGGQGAMNNYFLESAGLMAIVLGIYGLGPLWRIDARRTSVLLGLFGLTAILGMGFVTVKALNSAAPPTDLVPFRETLHDPVVLADGRGILAATNSGLRVAVNDPYFFAVAVKNRAVDPGPIIEDLRTGRIAGLVLERPLDSPEKAIIWPPEVLAVLRSNFEPAGRAGAFYLYRYRAKP